MEYTYSNTEAPGHKRHLLRTHLDVEVIITPFLEPRIEARVKFVTSSFLHLHKKDNVNLSLQFVSINIPRPTFVH